MDLIKVRAAVIGAAQVDTVNARELHAFLGSGRQFADWIKERIGQYGFSAEHDFTVHKSVNGRATVVDYYLSIDMAKELSMVERNEKGRQARQYFIECERRAKADPIAALNDPNVLRGMLLTYSEKVIVLQATITEQAPKVAAFDRIKLADGLICIRDAAKVLGISERNDLIPWLLKHKWCYRRPGTNKLTGFQDKTIAGSGYLEHKSVTTGTLEGGEKEHVQVKITAKGLAKLAEVFAQMNLDLEEKAA